MPQTASATVVKLSSPERTYVTARAAAMSGDRARSAQLLAELADSALSNEAITREAVSEAIGAGAMRLASRLSATLPAEAQPVEARLLRAADELRRGRGREAVAWLSSNAELGDIAFLAPFVSAWVASDRKDLRGALTQLDRIDSGNPLASAQSEHRALILLKFKRIADADPHVERALASAGGRAELLRFAFADAYLAAGDRSRAMAMVSGLGAESVAARARVQSGKLFGAQIATAREAYAELLTRLAIDLNRLRNRSLPISLTQIARHSDPDNSTAAILLGLFLEGRDRGQDAIDAYGLVSHDDPLSSQARDSEVRALIAADRSREALEIARREAARDAGVEDFARLGDALSALERHREAAAAYGQAHALAQSLPPADRWPLLLFQASELESANDWAEARRLLGAALALAPDEPLLLNFMGYAKLERGEDLDGAEAMIRRASALAPDNPSITDSLGWALYKRGRLDQAIDALQRAARDDPMQAEIHEHLGDALYSAGRKFEARFAWQAALATAEDEIAARVRTKIETGLTEQTAAP